MSIKKTYLLSIFESFIPLLIIITGFSGLIYGTLQHEIRMNANDPQIQMAQNIKNSLENGNQPASVIPFATVDLASSLSPFVIIYNKQGQVITTNALLDNRIPQLPIGIFDYVNTKGEDRLTWQPKLGVREATIVISYKGQADGFILVGRSLKEVEKREEYLLIEVIVGYFIILFGSLSSIIFIKHLNSKS